MNHDKRKTKNVILIISLFVGWSVSFFGSFLMAWFSGSKVFISIVVLIDITLLLTSIMMFRKERVDISIIMALAPTPAYLVYLSVFSLF